MHSLTGKLQGFVITFLRIYKVRWFIVQIYLTIGKIKMKILQPSS